MTLEEARNFILTADDSDLDEALTEAIPEEEDEHGREVGDLYLVLPYASNEICNGGFFQFYGNGIFVPELIVSQLERIGAQELANAVRQSMALFPEGKPLVRTAEELEPIDDKLLALGLTRDSFDEMESVWYAKCGELEDLCLAYVRANPDLYAGYLADA